MSFDLLDSSKWYRAASLVDRSAASTFAEAGNLDETDPEAERAARRFRRWASQAPFDTHDVFVDRLARAGVDEASLLKLLQESPDALRQRLGGVPAWLNELCQAYRDSVDVPPQTDSAMGILNIVFPLIQRGADKLAQEVERILSQHPQAPIDSSTIRAIFMPRLCAQLFQVIGKTMSLELNVARLEGNLKGETAEQRFNDFCSKMARPESALVVLEEYVVMARLAVECVDRWLIATVEFLDRLAQDIAEITDHFTGIIPEGGVGVLTAVNQGAGDTHRGGRSVAVITFSTGFKLVYKPRPLAVDAHFQSLLVWLNERGDHPRFPQLQILNRVSYGWVEHIVQSSCENVAQIQRFFQRQGGYLALLHELEATDFHFENVIAAGEFPMLIDLESLFHPQLTPQDSQQNQDDLLNIGLLPRRSAGNYAGLDISGLGAAAGQVTDRPVAQWDAVATDEMKMVLKPASLEGSMNRPSIDGRDIHAAQYVDAILTGFTSVYRTMMRCRPELLANDGPVQAFAQDEVRVLVRATQIYSLLLSDSLHPDVLRDALDRDRLLDRLWVAVLGWPRLCEVLTREHDDLLRGDIPLFTRRANSTDLQPTFGEPIRGFFNQPSIEQVRRRILTMDEQKLAGYLKVIRTSFGEQK